MGNSPPQPPSQACPSLFSRRNHFGTKVFVHSFDLPLLTTTGANEAVFVNEETRWNIWLRRDLGPASSLMLATSIYRNRFLDGDEPPEQTATNAAFLENHDLNDGTTVSVTPRLSIGVIEREGFAIRGSELVAEIEVANSVIGSDFDFVRGVVSWIGAARPHPARNLAAQARIGSKSGPEFQHKFYLGGLDTARGFQDGQFRGDHLWLANLEIRPTIVERTLWALQGNFFADLSKTWYTQSFGLEGFEDPFVSVGVGLRFILPRSYRGVLRVDFAWTQTPVLMSPSHKSSLKLTSGAGAPVGRRDMPAQQPPLESGRVHRTSKRDAVSGWEVFRLNVCATANCRSAWRQSPNSLRFTTFATHTPAR